MISWTMDEAIYGMPDYGMQVTTSRTFTPYIGDVGRTRYTSYNLTASIPVTLTYSWNGTTLASFRKDWEDRSKLAFGANWFRLRLPAPLARGLIGGLTAYSGLFNGHFVRPFQTTLAGYNLWTVAFTLDIDASKEFP